MMKNIYEHLISLRSISLYTEDRRFLALEEHKQIVEALDRKDEAGVEEITKKHIRKAKKAFFDNLVELND